MAALTKPDLEVMLDKKGKEVGALKAYWMSWLLGQRPKRLCLVAMH